MNQLALYGLIGYPLGHSFSHDFFTRKFHDEHIRAQYLNFEIPDIGDIMEVVAEYPELRGFNVTSPYKQQILPYIDSLSDEAREIGAVNVVKLVYAGNDNIILTGHNTDARGFAMDLRTILPADPCGLQALVLGSGGASRAVCHGLRAMGVEPTVVSRTPEHDRLSYTELTREVIAQHIIIVNATPLGMHPHEDEHPPIPFEFITDSHICYDLIYNPSHTIFLKKCAEQGATTRNGLGMLHNQAVLSWKIWNDNNL